MQFEWDARKNKENLRKHRLDLADAVSMFEGPMLVQPDVREDYGEDRWIAIGVTHGIVAVVAFSERGDN